MKQVTRIEYLLDEKKMLKKRIDEIDREIEYRKIYRTADCLSDKEVYILGFVKLGKSNPEIAQHCDLSVNTVKKHVSRILDKLNIKSRYDLIKLRCDEDV